MIVRHCLSRASSMLRNASAARRGLAPPPKLRRPFDAASPLPLRCSSLSSLPVSRSRRAESERKKRNQTSPTFSRAAAVPDRGLDLATSKEEKKKPPPPLLLGDGLPTQEAAYDALARIALELLEEAAEKDRKNKKKRVVVGLAGGPGSGKSTAAAAVVAKVNELWRERQRQRSSEGEGEDDNDHDDDEIAVVLPMDGFHLTRAQLAASTDPSPEEMFARRGAHWTFDGAAFVQTVRDVVEAGDAKEEDGEQSKTVLAPSFDHGVGDPCPGAVAIKPQHRLVVVEGNYLLLPLEPWASLLPLFDQSWFLDVRVGEAMERVRARQLAVGVSAEVSQARVEGNDRPNGELVASTKARADVVVRGDLPL